MNTITSMMAGTVSNILIKPGDKIVKGQEIIILESMKMLIPIESEREGVIEEIKVDIGDFVNEEDILVTLV
jgi:acetyl-CoA carboxylase biotin carboxyl carrier protein